MSSHLRISNPVGHDAVNDPADVRVVQAALAVVLGRDLRPDGICGPDTIEAIRAYQATTPRSVDGRCDPGSRTLRRLRADLAAAPAAGRPAGWEGDPARWSQAQKLDSLHPAFRAGVAAVLDALRAAGFAPELAVAWRPVDGLFAFANAQLADGTPDAWAVDVIDTGEAPGFWDALGAATRAQGLVWGGDGAVANLTRVQGFPNSELRRIKRESGLS